jgi:hypothetical protein
MTHQKNTGNNILKIKDEFLSATHKLSYILNNAEVLAQDHSPLHNVIDKINYLYREYINAKIEFTEQQNK